MPFHVGRFVIQATGLKAGFSMKRSTAYKLAGRRHGAQKGPAPEKSREIRFSALPPGQTEDALKALCLFKGLHVAPVPGTQRRLRVRYSILDYSLEMLENALRQAGYHLDNTLYSKLVRALVYFCEETERHNLLSPERLIKQSNEVYIQAYEQHPHGDHDETPVDLREYK
jgi:hypothetical protein